MHFLNRIGALILLVCVASLSHVATLYVACGSTPATIFWVLYPITVILGFFMWLKDWDNYYMFSFKWYDK